MHVDLRCAETNQPGRKKPGNQPPQKTLTFLCKEGEDAAWSGQLFVAGRQEQSKVEQKEKRPLPRTSHISNRQTRSSAEELWAAGLDRAPHGGHDMANLRKELPSPGETRSQEDPETHSRGLRGRKPQLCGGKRGGELFQPVSTFLARRSAAGSED